MSRPIMRLPHSTVTNEHLDQIFVMYDLIKEDGVILPNSTTLIDHPLLGKIGFYLYLFEDGLRVPPSVFFGLIVEAYKIHIF